LEITLCLRWKHTTKCFHCQLKEKIWEDLIDTKKESYHHGDLKKTLLDAGLELLREKGANNFSLRELSRRAGVSHTAPYRHFSDRNDLLAALAENGFRSLSRSMRESLVGTEDSGERLFLIARAYIRFGLDNLDLYRLLFSAHISQEIYLTHPPLQEAASELFGVLLEEIARAQERGGLRPGPPMELGVICWSMVHGLASLLIEGQLVSYEGWELPNTVTDPEKLIRGAFAILMTGMGIFPNRA
jgi:AcrR family transcriptional regulator